MYLQIGIEKMYEIYSFVIKSTTNDFVLVLLTQAFLITQQISMRPLSLFRLFTDIRRPRSLRFLDFLLNFYLNFINFHFEQPIKKLTIKFSRVIFEKIWSCLYHTHATQLCIKMQHINKCFSFSLKKIIYIYLLYNNNLNN